jgi:hypothetical protein
LVKKRAESQKKRNYKVRRTFLNIQAPKISSKRKIGSSLGGDIDKINIERS